MNDTKKKIPYWDIIHWDPVSFLTLHEGVASRIYYDRVSPSLIQDLLLIVKGVFGGIIRLFQAIFNSMISDNSISISVDKPYCLLITVGSAKYASEERDVIDACNKKGLSVLVAYSDRIRCSKSPDESVLLFQYLKAKNYVVAMINWILVVTSEIHNIFSSDKKRRSLFVISIFSIRQYITYKTLAKRLIEVNGLPQALVTLCPSAAFSVAIVENLKNNGVLTAGIRTQTTSFAAEHLSINTDILFCKSIHERTVYKDLFIEKPTLVDACIMSIPEVYQNKPLSLPDEYVLVLGTAPDSTQNYGEYEEFNEVLYRVAERAKLPIVFKGHNLAKDLDDEWFESSGVDRRGNLRISDISYNRELIDRATLVISASSTLLYYAIIANKPIIIVSKKKCLESIPDEFEMSPIIRISFEQLIESYRFDWVTINDSANKTARWFENNYFLHKGADYIISYLC